MKLNDVQTLYVRSMGKALKVTAIFTDVDKCNEYMESSAGKDCGVVAEFKPHGSDRDQTTFILCAKMYDKGVTIAEDK